MEVAYEEEVENLIRQMRELSKQIKELNYRIKMDMKGNMDISRHRQSKWIKFKNDKWTEYKESGGDIKYRDYLKEIGNMWSKLTYEEKDNYK